MTLADRVYIINNGHIVETLDRPAVRDQPDCCTAIWVSDPYASTAVSRHRPR